MLHQQLKINIEKEACVVVLFTARLQSGKILALRSSRSGTSSRSSNVDVLRLESFELMGPFVLAPAARLQAGVAVGPIGHGPLRKCFGSFYRVLSTKPQRRIKIRGPERAEVKIVTMMCCTYSTSGWRRSYEGEIVVVSRIGQGCNTRETTQALARLAVWSLPLPPEVW